VDVREQYRINISNRFAALEKLDDSKNMNTAWENIKENIKISDNEFVVSWKGNSVNYGLMKNVHNL
jgi:hypothetical protein